MCKGIGLDLCEISRMDHLRMMTRFTERYFTEGERAYIQSKGKNASQTMAGLFAAKEAFAKAVGRGIDFDLREVEIVHDDMGRPGYCLHGSVLERTKGERFSLSISHDGGIAGAVCLREDDEDAVTRA